MTEFENRNKNELPPPEESNESDIEAQLEVIPAEYPPLPADVLAEISAARGKNGLSRGDAEILQRNWMIEQRLSAINDAREAGTVSTEVANALELDALRKMRDNIHFYGAAVSIRTAHRKMEAHGMPPLNVSQPGRPPFSPDGASKLEF